MLFLKHFLWNPLQFLCNVKVTTALCFMRWLILKHDEYVFYIALNLLLGWFWGLVNVYKDLHVSDQNKTWNNQCDCSVSIPWHPRKSRNGSRAWRTLPSALIQYRWRRLRGYERTNKQTKKPQQRNATIKTCNLGFVEDYWDTQWVRFHWLITFSADFH